MLEKTMVVGAFQCNCRLIACPRTGEGILVDPGDEPQKILSHLKDVRIANGAPVQIKYLLHTHGHLDHIGGTRGVKEGLVADLQNGVPQIALHRGDELLYTSLKMQGSLFGFQYNDPLPIEHYLEDGEEIRLGDLQLSVIHTPGHSPGSICLRIHENSSARAKETLLTGDTLFQGSVGRTDLWGADQDLMFKSIRQRILTLDDDTRVCPGHGNNSSIGIEKRSNPFLV
jgi:glyoxylase-like metal-dependent hydrolase (beta-lactamase superfamily II)